MTIYSMIETILIGPLKLVFEIIYETAYRITGHPGLSIVFLSLAMNILVLPLYRRADIMQEEIRDKEAELQENVKHIKQTFTGDERMMILQTYYRHNHYKPTDSLKGIISLLLQIPFFIAAYQFLSHLELLQGIVLGPIKDLGAPDGLLTIGGITINILPVLMTLINMLSGALYTKGFPLKTKIQTYGIALIFLLFLYTSPAGLVFYWTLNNVFSLIKNIFYKLKNPAKVLSILSTIIGLAVLFYGVAIYHTDYMNRKIFVVAVGMLLLIPLILLLLKRIPTKRWNLPSGKKKNIGPDGRLFLSGAVFLTLLIGVLIPSVFIEASPQEYVDINYFHNPLWYIVKCFCMAAGTFLIWMRVFYWLTDTTGKVIFGRLVLALCGMTLVNYMFFGTDLGIISSTLQYDGGMWFSRQQKVINLLILMIVAAIIYFCVCRWKKAVMNLLIISIVAIGIMSVWNFITIKTSIDKITKQYIVNNEIPEFQLSTTGQNVVVIMLDRAMGEYIPYIFQEKPELVEQFAGFTYYENTISYGSNTNFGSPPLFGGYEYTPVEMNRRSDELLVSKHNEALLLMPMIFSENGYDVTVFDPPYANYQWVSDLSIYKECPSDVSAYYISGRFEDVEVKQAVIDQNYRNFFCFSIMKTMPLFLQPIIYSDGRYYQIDSNKDTEELIYTVQTRDSISVADGKDVNFMESYNGLSSLQDMTDVITDECDTLLIMTNKITHDAMILQEPDYVPVWHVDNTPYDEENSERFIINDRKLSVETEWHMGPYHANMAAMILLGNWFSYLRENNVYDNTRIILVSDHGYPYGQLEEMIIDVDDDDKGFIDVEAFYPLLMVKDFYSDEFIMSDDFMTNADVPTLAMEGIISDPINPFTGNPINGDEKTAHDQFIIVSDIWDITENNGYSFLPSEWVSVHDNIWDANNWTYYDVETVLSEHAAP